jgi:hypothetical protein
MINLQDLESRLQLLEGQLQQSADSYAQARKDLEQKLANHNALEGAVMLLRQMVAEEKAKESTIPIEDVIPA